MAKEPPHRHNGGPLSDEDARKLWDHVRAREVLEEQKADIAADISARKALIKADGFDTNMVELVIKRRKAGEGETRTADEIVRVYEEGLREQGALPLEQTRIAAPPRRSVEEIAQATHGQEAPPMPEKVPDAAPEPVDDEGQYLAAVALVKEHNNASVSWLQRQMRIGYNAASRLVERMETERVVTKPDANGRRGVALFD